MKIEISKFNSLYLAFLPSTLVLLTNAPYLYASYLTVAYFDFILAIAINFLSCLLLFSVTLFSRTFYLISTILIISLNSGGAYYKYTYSISLSAEAVESIIHANLKEIGNSFDHKIWLWGIVLSIIPNIYLYFLSKRYTFSFKNCVSNITTSLLMVMIFSILSSSYIWHVKFYEKALKGMMPYNYVIAMVNYIKKKQIHTGEKLNSFIKEENKHHKNLKFIFIIGESARSDHLSVNGYHRKTTPSLEKQTNLISYTNAYALATYTIGGVENMFKRKVNESHYSLIKLMEQNNFKTFWFSNHRFENDVVTSIALESQTNLFRDRVLADYPINSHDEVLIDYVKEAMTKNSDDNLFIVLHTLGSHYSYDLRYSDEFMKFIPTCKEQHSFFGREHCNDVNKIINAYDNSILYTDFFLSRLFETLKDENAIVVYVSDHGESLGENGVFFHTADYAYAPKEQLHIPILFWASEKFLSNSNNLKMFRNAQKNKAANITQHNIYHSIPHCIGFNRNIDPTFSICN
jgi:lipid A ethanolaminephosphotransferase